MLFAGSTWLAGPTQAVGDGEKSPAPSVFHPRSTCHNVRQLTFGGTMPKPIFRGRQISDLYAPGRRRPSIRCSRCRSTRPMESREAQAREHLARDERLAATFFRPAIAFCFLLRTRRVPTAPLARLFATLRLAHLQHYQYLHGEADGSDFAPADHTPGTMRNPPSAATQTDHLHVDAQTATSTSTR